MNDKKILKMFPELFASIVGQKAAIKRVIHELDCSLYTKVFQNTIYTAGKGQGKTTLARETAKGLVLFDADGKLEMVEGKNGPKPKRKSFVEVNCSTVKNLKQFINSIIIPYVQDKDVTVFFDEASELPKDVSMALLTILNPNPENRTTFAYEEYVCDFDFRRQTFLFATSEPQQVFHALLDRLERIDLEDYTYDDLAQIVQRGAKDVVFEPSALDSVSKVLRGNARAAQMMAGKLMNYLRGKKTFTNKDWSNISSILGILPLGLNASELIILRHLAISTDGTSLTCLAAKTGLSRESLQRDYEMYIQKHGLMEITTGGRTITAKGLEYLKALDA